MQKQLNENVLISDKVGKGISFGTFGELLQGVQAENDLDFIVTLPINRYSQAEFSPDGTGELKVIPTFKQKSALLAIRLLNHFTLPIGGTLSIESDLPAGKGLASSSADLVATSRSIASAYNLEVPVELLQKFIGEIEPTDGVMHSGVVSFYHRQVKLGEVFGSIPPLTILAIDEGGEVDTVEFNKVSKSYTLKEKLEYTQLNNQLRQAFLENDVYSIGKVATRSAIMNQSWQEKRSLDYFLRLSTKYDALGVVVAHSGTFIGLLLWQEDESYNQKFSEIRNELQEEYEQTHTYHTL
ncbi:hypothetical protein U3A55_00025 [Salarchaeum sp. III]|uniref:GHMP family kinase ATP-binding protein n=1 Tax=Salarchaeum sp. III TaxID=3107927 RepID=UPI002EDAE362